MEKTIGSLNKYLVLEKIGQGKFGEVYKAMNQKSKELVAIKKETKNSCFSLLKHESQILNYLYRHGCKKIPFIYWYGMEQNEYYLVMTLFTPISNVYPFPIPVFHLKKKMICMINIIKSIHEHFVIHRDIKPQNFMEKHGDIFLIDFGLSTIYIDEENNHIENSLSHERIIGTPNYMSLNIHDGNRASRRDDLISIGYVYLFFLYGYVPWENNRTGDNPSMEMKKQIKMEYHGISCLSSSFVRDKYAVETCDTVNNMETAFPESNELDAYFRYCYQMEYYETPNYIDLITLFLDN